MNPTDSPQQAIPSNNPLSVMGPGESMVCEISRHPIGLLGVYLTTGLIIAVAVAAAVLSPLLMPDASAAFKLGVVLIAVVVMAITLLFAYIGAIIYKGNRWIVTSDSITEITRTGLFNHQSSQLSLANLEDVTVDQDGILEQMLGYGELHVETAGEHSKFIFPFCPNPNDYARKIIGAHEAYIAHRPDETMTANRPLAAVENFNQTPPQDS